MDLSFNTKTLTQETPPPVIERIAGNTYIYRYDLKEDIIDNINNEAIEGKNYSFVEVILKGYPNFNEVVKYLLRQLVSLEDELKMINDYNEVVLLSSDAANTKAYKVYIQYLILRSEIKKKVAFDFKINGY